MSVPFLISRAQYPSLFSKSYEVQDMVYKLTPLLAFSIVLTNVQPAVSGVAVGAGWQAFVAYVNIICYYVFGIPLGIVLARVLNMGVRGIWYGMAVGTFIQTMVLFCLVYKTNWNKEASVAAKRIGKWGGEDEADVKENDLEM